MKQRTDEKAPHFPWCSYEIHNDCCPGLARCDCPVGPLVAENERLREGIRETVEGLDRADAYDTPLYERLVALLDED